jgi:GT2 family glycosyltransferase
VDRPSDGDVEVLVVAYGAPELLDRCLATLGGGLAVVVVDNSSDPLVRAVVQRHGADYVDPGANLGFAGGVNAGTARRHLPHADLLLLNPDAEISPDAVGRLHRCLGAMPDAACVAPDQTDPGGHEHARVAWPFPTPLGAWAEAAGIGRHRHGDEFMIGSILLLRAEALAQVGAFDERFFLYAEETDWQFRARRLGWRSALCPEVVATHVGAGTGGNTIERDVRFHASNERYIRKHYGVPGWWTFRSGVMAGALVRALVLRGDRAKAAAARFHLYRIGPCHAESALAPPAP